MTISHLGFTFFVEDELDARLLCWYLEKSMYELATEAFGLMARRAA